MSASDNLNPDTLEGVTGMIETFSYYLNLRLMSKTQGIDIKIPATVDQIVEMAVRLPKPEVASWAALAVGKIPSKAKSKAKTEAAENGDEGKRVRARWSDANKAEMVRLVEDADFREETLGKEGTRLGHVNWAALARRYGFSGTAPIHRQYQVITKKEPPGVAKRKEVTEGGEPSVKKAKPSSGAIAVDIDGWKEAEHLELIKLVEDESHRKKVTGKRHLKWSRIAEALGKGKKECKNKYTTLTGKDIDD